MKCLLKRKQEVEFQWSIPKVRILKHNTSIKKIQGQETVVELYPGRMGSEL